MFRWSDVEGAKLNVNKLEFEALGVAVFFLVGRFSLLSARVFGDHVRKVFGGLGCFLRRNGLFVRGTNGAFIIERAVFQSVGVESDFDATGASLSLFAIGFGRHDVRVRRADDLVGADRGLLRG